MASPEVPKYNASLKAFSTSINLSATIGVFVTIIALALIATAISNQKLDQIGLGFAMAYVGCGLIGLAISGIFLRQTAKIIVEGLGGSIATEPRAGIDPNALMMDSSYDIVKDPEDKKFVGKLSARQYDAWVNAGQPPLKGFWLINGNEDFFDWLKNQK